MSQLTNLLTSLQTQILTVYPTASIYFDTLPSKDDNNSYPLFEITIEAIQDANFAASNITETQIGIVMYARTSQDKYSLAGIDERISANNAIRSILDEWSGMPSVIGYMALSNISVKYLDGLVSGEAGSFSNTTIRIGLNFTIQYRETSII
jgi:hypothetical protein